MPTNTKSGRDEIFSMNPPPSEINMTKLHKFFAQGGHINMEKADMRDITEYFDACKAKGFMPMMDYHREGCRGVFEFNNYDEWRKNQ
jgi:hypothetical protein